MKGWAVYGGRMDWSGWLKKSQSSLRGLTAARLYLSLYGGCFLLVIHFISEGLLLSAHAPVWKKGGQEKEEAEQNKCEDIW